MSNVDAIFLKIKEALISSNGAKLTRKFPGSCKFIVDCKGSTKILRISLKAKPIVVETGGDAEEKSDLVVTCSDDTFVKLFDGSLKPQQAFVKKLIKIKGKMSLAMKLQAVVKGVRMYGTRAKL
ncbi:hypothetical protein TrRE_jg6238 [Triparma retinervis]|uniref:SCP2 domain-containing protein n=1 Tax=Triparma retinervis TaxID=2557542 RepID=A0A9W7FGG1_9STRA|nr:hypothetical protein TrRE_jg6238 [Triparma retinervis]